MWLDFESRFGDRWPNNDLLTTNIDIKVPEQVRQVLSEQASSKSTLPRGIFLLGTDSVKMRVKDRRLKWRDRPRSDFHAYSWYLQHSAHAPFRTSLTDITDTVSLDNRREIANNTTTSYSWETKRIHVRDIAYAKPRVVPRPPLTTFRNAVEEQHNNYETALKRFDRSSLVLDEAQEDLHKRAQQLLHCSSFAIKRPQLAGAATLRRGLATQSVLDLREFDRALNYTDISDPGSSRASLSKFTIPRIPWLDGERPRHLSEADESAT